MGKLTNLFCCLFLFKDLDIDWVPLSNHNNNARNKSIDLIKATKQISRGSQRRKRRSSESPQSQRLAEQKEQRSKQRNQVGLMVNDLVD